MLLYLQSGGARRDGAAMGAAGSAPMAAGHVTSALSRPLLETGNRFQVAARHVTTTGHSPRVKMAAHHVITPPPRSHGYGREPGQDGGTHAVSTGHGGAATLSPLRITTCNTTNLLKTAFIVPPQIAAPKWPSFSPHLPRRRRRRP